MSNELKQHAQNSNLGALVETKGLTKTLAALGCFQPNHKHQVSVFILSKHAAN